MEYDKKRDEGKISRRDFFRASALAGSMLAAEQGLTRWAEAMEMKPGGEQISRTTARVRQAIPSTCANCFARCGVFAYVEDGQLQKIGGNPNHPNNRGRLCAKGQAGVNVLYDPERVLYPLRRRGARGEGKWERISWDEALDQVAQRLRDLRERGHPEQFVYHSERDVTTAAFARRFVHAVGSPHCLLPLSIAGANKTLAHRLTWGADFDINDVAYTEYILNFGANPFEAHILRTSFAQRIVESRTMRYFNGRAHPRAKLVTFDVRCSNTAGRSDEWHPIKPGTDGIVALAMAHVIMEKELYDREFLEKWTNCPIPELKAHLAQFTPERAQAVSGVPADDIRQIAVEFATIKPATTISTGGCSKHQNGVATERCLLLLNAITGNIDVRGGYCLPRRYEFADPPPVPPAPAGPSALLEPPDLPLVHHGVPERLPALVRSGALEVGVYMTYQANPAYSSPECDKFAALLKDEGRIPFYVAVDSMMSESAALADFVLPAATYLERWELDSPPAFQMVPLVSLRQPVVTPLGESRAFTDIVLALAQSLGPAVRRYFPFTSTQDYLRATLVRIDKLVAAGGLEYLRQKGFWFDAAAEPEYQRYRREGFRTPSGKFEIDSATLARHSHEPLPTYQPLPHSEELKPDECYLTTFQWNMHTHFQTANCMLLSEIVHANPLWINAETAKALGIENGDAVRVTSKAGSFVTKAWVTQGIHPKVVAASDSCGHRGYGHVAQAEPFASSDPETKLVWWGKEGNGAHPNPAIAAAIDPIGGGQGWMDTVVRISRA